MEYYLKSAAISWILSFAATIWATSELKKEGKDVANEAANLFLLAMFLTIFSFCILLH